MDSQSNLVHKNKNASINNTYEYSSYFFPNILHIRCRAVISLNYVLTKWNM